MALGYNNDRLSEGAKDMAAKDSTPIPSDKNFPPVSEDRLSSGAKKAFMKERPIFGNKLQGGYQVPADAAPEVKAVLTQDGKLFSVAEDGKIVEHPQNWSKLSQVIDESMSKFSGMAKGIGDKISGAATGVKNSILDKAYELDDHPLAGKVRDAADRVVQGAKSVGGKIADAAYAADDLPGARGIVARAIPRVAGAAGSAIGAAATSPVLAFLTGMAPSPAGEGEDAELSAMDNRDAAQAAQASVKTPEPAGPDLSSQTQTAMGQPDPTINMAAKPTINADKNPTPQTPIGQDMPKAATMSDGVTGQVGQVDTKGGAFPIYQKNSAEAQDFRTAFAQAVKSGVPTFMWQGREYTSQVKK